MSRVPADTKSRFDNINVGEEEQSESVVDDGSSKALMDKFAEIKAKLDQHEYATQNLKDNKITPHDQARVAALVSLADSQTALQKEMYNLIVLLNNFYSGN